ncbi:MAG: DUF5686 family protein, partial [Tannerella sp.]|nr:DUF5686 family protein [Tannerella sp.]
MNRVTWIWLFLFLLSGLPAKTEAQSPPADSVMRRVIANAGRYRDLLRNYEAEVYTKGRTQILKQNFLMRYAGHLFPVNRKHPDMVFEMLSLSKFEAPNSFFHDFKALNGSSIPNRRKQQELQMFLNLNIYSSTAFDDAILMPTAGQAFRYYAFRVESVDTLSDGQHVFHVRFRPKRVSPKLVSGYMMVSDRGWTIRRIGFSGRYAFADFGLYVDFGRQVSDFNLPETIDLSLTYRMLGNVVSSSYHSRFTYLSVVRGWDVLDLVTDKRPKLDLTDSYGNSVSGAVPVVTDSTYWRSKRDQPLLDEEKELYAGAQLPADSLSNPSYRNGMLRLAEMMVGD